MRRTSVKSALDKIGMCVIMKGMNFESHLTAIHRKSASMPLQRTLDANLIDKSDRILDYGCGHGSDVAILNARGYKAFGYDPYYFPRLPQGQFDVVLCLYVLNVIDGNDQRLATLELIRHECKPGARIITAVRGTKEVERHAIKGRWIDWHDGFITPKTFQKGFSEQELIKLHPFQYERTLVNTQACVCIVTSLLPLPL